MSGYKPNDKAVGELKFLKKHVTIKKDDANGNKDDAFNATNVKAIDRRKDDHGYNPGEDKAVYEMNMSSAQKISSVRSKHINDDAYYVVHKDTGDIHTKLSTGRKDLATSIASSKKDHIALSGLSYKMKFGHKMVNEDKVMKNFGAFRDKFPVENIVVESVTNTPPVEPLFESNERAEKNYNFHVGEARHYLKKIGEALDAHEERARNHKPMYGGEAGIHWGHSGDVNHVHNTLRDIHAMIAPPKKLAEGVEEIDEEFEDLDALLTEFFACLNEDEMLIAQAIIDDENEEVLEEFISDHFDIVFEGRVWEDEELDEASAAAAGRAAERDWVSGMSDKGSTEVKHNLKRGTKVVSSHKSESEALTAYKGLSDTDRKGVKIVREETVEFDLSELTEEQLDELSKKTLGSYMRKSITAATNTASKIGNAEGRSRLHSVRGETSSASLRKKEADWHEDKLLRRLKGQGKAVAKLTKEEFEQLDELSRNTIKNYMSKKLDRSRTTSSMGQTRRDMKGLNRGAMRLRGNPPDLEKKD